MEKAKKTDSPVRHWWIFWVALPLVLLFIASLIYLYLHAEQIISKTIVKTVHDRSNGVYDIHYDDLQVSIFSRSIIINQLELIPDTSMVKMDSTEALYQISAKKISLNGFSPLAYMINDVVRLEDFIIDEPEVEVIGAAGHKKNNDQDVRTVIQNELTRYFNDLIINELRIEHAVVDIPGLESSPVFSAIGSISIILDNVRIKDQKRQDTSSLFFSENAELILHDLQYRIKSIEHDLKVDQIRISSGEKQISIENIFLEPAVSDSLMSIYRIFIPEVSLVDVNIDTIINNGHMMAEKILISKPGILLNILTDSIKPKQYNLKDTSLLKLPGDLTFLKVNHLYINEGSIRYLENNDTTGNFFEIHSFTGIIDTIEFDSLISRERLYRLMNYRSSFTGKNVNIVLHDLEHHIHMDMLNVSPAKQKLVATHVEISPNESAGNHIEGKINAVEMKGLDYPSLIKSHAIYTSDLFLDSADIKMVVNKKGRAATEDGKSITYFELDTFRIRNSHFNLNHKVKGKTGISLSTDVEMSLYDFSPDTIQHKGSQPVNLKMAEIYLKNTSVRKPGKFSVNFSDFNFNSRDEVLFCHDLLSRVWGDKLSPLSIELKDMAIKGFKMEDFLKQGEANFVLLVLNNPAFYMDTTGHAGGNIDPGELQRQIAGEITSLINQLRIHHLDVNQLEFHLKHDEGLTSRTEIENIYLDVKDIDIRKWRLQNKKPLFADDIMLEIRDFKNYTPDGSAEIAFDRLKLNRQSNSLLLDSLTIMPIEKQEENTTTSFFSSKILFSGFDFDQLYFNNQLISDKLFFESAELDLKAFLPTESKTQTEGITGITFPSAIKKIYLKSVDIEKAKLNYENIDDQISFNYELNLNHVSVEGGQKFTPGEDALPVKNFSIRLWDFQSNFGISGSTLKMDKLSYSTIDGNLNAKAVNVMPVMNDPLEYLESHDKKMAIEMKVPDLLINDFQFNDLYLHDKIDLDLLQTDEIDFTMYIRRLPSETETTVTKTKLPEFLKQLKLDLFQFEEMDVDIFRYANDTVELFSLKDIKGRLNRFDMNENSSFDQAIFEAGDLYLSKENFTYRTPDSMYILSADNIALSTGNSTLAFDSFQVIPRYAPFKFSRKLGYQTDRVEIKGQRVSVTGMDFGSFFNNSGLLINDVVLSDFDIFLFRDKRVAFPAWHRSKMPQEMLRDLPFPVDISIVRMNNFKIKYDEMAPNAAEPGEVIFENMQGKLINVTNKTSSIAKDPLMQLKLKGVMLDEGIMNVQLNMLLDSPADTFSFYGSLSSMHLPVINSLSRNLFGVAVKKGRGSVDTLMIFGNNRYETGYMVFPYKKFRIQLIDPQTGERGGIGDGIMTFLANNILLKSNNPRAGQSVRVGRIFFKRNPRKSIFNFLWKGIMSGVESTLGYNTREQKKEIKAFKEEIKKD